jgi:hypothetical protein
LICSWWLRAVCCLLQFDGVLENVSQDVVYNTCVQEAVDSSLAGYNSTVFAYGQVGSSSDVHSRTVAESSVHDH